jgi:hypothetical protein
VEDGKTKEEYLDDFGLHASVLLETYFSSMKDWLQETDQQFKKLFKEFQYQSTAEQDAFSKRFEMVAINRIDMWVAQDDRLREKFKNLYAAYKEKLHFEDMRRRFDAEEKALYTEMTNLVEKANAFGEEWTQQMDKAGMSLKNPIVRRTIQWFKDLSIDELRKTYQLSRK